MSSPYMVLKEMSCLPGANDLNDCTYDFSKNLDVCARDVFVRYGSGKITITENENVVTICNPKTRSVYQSLLIWFLVGYILISGQYIY